MATTSRSSIAALAARLDSFIPHVLAITGTPGLSISLSYRGATWAKAYGYANLHPKRPFTTLSAIRAGSITKLYTATAFLQLVERGHLALDEPVTSFAPELEFTNPLGNRPITPLDLMTFRSGLRTDTLDAHLEVPPPLDSYLREELRRNIRREYHGYAGDDSVVSRWACPVGSAYNYSSFGIAILGYLVAHCNPERLTLSDYVRQYVCVPLGMHNTVLPPVQAHPHVPRQIAESAATGYARMGSLYFPTPTFHSATYPACSLLTTPTDHLQWLLAIMNRGTHRGYELLQPDTVDLMLTPHVTADDMMPGTTVTNGLVIELSPPGSLPFHFGELGAYAWGWWTDSQAFPEEELAWAITANKWDLPRWINPPAEAPVGIVGRYIRTYLEGNFHAISDPDETTWAWKQHYLAGFTLAERSYGLLGIQPSSDAAKHLARSGACSWTSNTEPQPLTAIDGMDEGIQDALRGGVTPSGITHQLGRLKIPPEALSAVAASLFPRGELRMPMSYYADNDATS